MRGCGQQWRNASPFRLDGWKFLSHVPMHHHGARRDSVKERWEQMCCSSLVASGFPSPPSVPDLHAQTPRVSQFCAWSAQFSPSFAALLMTHTSKCTLSTARYILCACRRIATLNESIVMSAGIPTCKCSRQVGNAPDCNWGWTAMTMSTDKFSSVDSRRVRPC